jgi:predicted enzyme related to lactoylglutathione lyase
MSKAMSAVDMRLEVVVIPVSNVDRAKRFYGQLGWRLDADFRVGDGFRVVQFTPSGSATSIHFGEGLAPTAPSSAVSLFLIVSDIEAAHAELVERGVAVGDVFHRQVGEKAEPGVDPRRRSYTSIALASALRRAATAHGEHEKRTGEHDETWPDWYAEYLVQEQAGGQLPL